MPITEPFHFESRLTAYLNLIVRERIKPFLRAFPNHPLIREIFVRNAFYAKILTYSIAGREPTLACFEYLDINADPEVLYQNGLYLYRKWHSIGLDKAVFNYCQLVNRVLARIPFTNAGVGNNELPDMCQDEFNIRVYIKEMISKNVDGRPNQGDFKKKIKNLALNA